jgi:hypothetical protein
MAKVKQMTTKQVNCRGCNQPMFIFVEQNLDCAICDSCLCDMQD